MHDRRRRSRPAIVTLLALAALAWSATAPLTAFGAVGISLAPVTDGLVSPDADHQRARRHEPAVRRRAARHHPGDPGRRPATGRLHEHHRQGRGRRRARPARAGVRPAASRPTTGCSSTTRAMAATSSCRGSRRTPRAPMSSRAPPARCCSSSTAPRATTTAARWRSARTATCTSASVTAAAAATRANNAQNKATAPRQDPAHQRQRHRARAVRPLLGPAEQPVLRLQAGSRGDLGLRRAQSVADLVRPRHGQAVHRGRRAEPLRGDRPREGRLHGRPQLRLERDGGDALLHGLASARSPATRCPTPSTRTTTATARSPAGMSIAGRPRRLSSGCTSSPTTAAVGSGPSRTTAWR